MKRRAFCSAGRRRRVRQHGFTLIEAMVVIAITAILIAMAAPSMRSLIERNGVAGSVNAFMGALSYTRAEALKRGVVVTMCRSVDAETVAAPACATGRDWHSGWLVFADFAGNGIFDPADGDILLRAHGSVSQSGSVRQNVGDSTKFPSLSFDPTGMLRPSGISNFEFRSPSNAPEMRRVACVSWSGRVRLIAHADELCSP